MEFVEGRPFSEWAGQKGLGLRAKIAVLRDVAAAVHHAHEEGVLHRDLKPQNILVAAKNRAVVMDFGLAKAMGGDTGLSLTGDGLVVGTPAYMSPEQARGDKTVDGRTDVYAIGVMLYELLAGRKPFDGETAIEILMKASKERAAPPSSTRLMAPDPAADRVIESICLKALERNPQDRYASARALASDLTRWLDGEAVHITTVRRRARSQPKSRAWIFVSIGVAALAAIGVVVALPGPAPAGAEAELERARRYLREKKYTDARV
jgi:serine/threonine-protein kinase